MSFGALNVLEVAEKYATGSISVLCSKGVNYTIQPEGGFTGSAAAGSRQILSNSTSANNVLSIAMQFQNSSSNWVDWAREGTNGALGSGFARISGTGTGDIEQPTVHPLISIFLGNQRVRSYYPSSINEYNNQAIPGNYIANVTATITY